jgi:hypothetical protein
LRAAGDVTGNHDRDTKVTQCACEGECGRSEYAARSERQSDTKKDHPAAETECAGCSLKFGVDTFKCSAKTFGNQWQRVNRSGNDRSSDGEREPNTQAVIQKPAERGAGAEQDQQVVTKYRRRQHQRQRD